MAKEWLKPSPQPKAALGKPHSPLLRAEAGIVRFVLGQGDEIKAARDKAGVNLGAL